MLSDEINLARSSGISLIEMMVVIGIVGILFSLALPTYRVWIQNTQIRTAAESILTGLQLARNEAVKRNIRVKFQLDNDSGTDWRICLPNSATGICPDTSQDIQSHVAGDGTTNAQIGILRQNDAAVAFTTGLTAGSNVPASVTFDFFGRAINTTDVARIDVLNLTLSSSDQRRLVVLITPTGSIRMCDPKLPTTVPKNPQAC